MKKPDSKFQTHISEPRWQRIASLVIFLILVFGWLFFIVAFHGKK